MSDSNLNTSSFGIDTSDIGFMKDLADDEPPPPDIPQAYGQAQDTFSMAVDDNMLLDPSVAAGTAHPHLLLLAWLHQGFFFGQDTTGQPTENKTRPNEFSKRLLKASVAPPTLCVNPQVLILKGPAPPILRSCCAICPAQENLLDCRGCRAISYCCEEHRQIHHKDHAADCQAIVECRQRVQHLRQELSSSTPSPFIVWVGSFWSMQNTAAYLTAICDLARKFGRIYHRTAIERQLVLALHVLYLGGRSDTQGFRFQIPAFMIRIGRDQDCYDFIKWRNNTRNLNRTALEVLRERFQNPMRALPVLANPQADFVGCYNEDILEPIEVFRAPTPFQTMVPLCLYRLTPGGQPLPNEIIDMILRLVPDKEIVIQRRELMEDQAAREDALVDLTLQIIQIYSMVKDQNPYIWEALVWPHRGHDQWVADQDRFNAFWVMDMGACADWNWNSWMETPGAIPFLMKLMQEEGDL